jgi:hypothetical protein
MNSEIELSRQVFFALQKTDFVSFKEKEAWK